LKQPERRSSENTLLIRRKRIWITGASSGIGKALALKLAATNNRVVISGRNLESLEQVVAESQSATQGADIQALVYDVTDDSASAEIAQQLEQLLGGLDIVVACAGHCEYVDNGDCQVDMFRRVYDVNVFGAVNTLAASLPLLKATGEEPQVVAVASLSAVVGLPRAEAYGSSKAAMNYLFDSLRLDLHQSQIDVTVINPGFVQTPMTRQNDFPMPFLMNPEQAAECMVAGIAARKRRVNFPLRLWLSLKLAAAIPPLWYSVIGPRLARKESR
jgi:short-subunit dehydrogenase